jgi:hypothetical protein
VCKLCTKWGIEPLENEAELKEAIAEISRQMELQPSSVMHYSDLLDKLLDGRELDQEEPDLGFGEYEGGEEEPKW